MMVANRDGVFDELAMVYGSPCGDSGKIKEHNHWTHVELKTGSGKYSEASEQSTSE